MSSTSIPDYSPYHTLYYQHSECEHYINTIANCVFPSSNLKSLATTIAEYANDLIPYFGPYDWKHLHEHVEDEIQNYGLPPKEIVDFLKRPDAFEPNRLNIETHLPPIYIPRRIRGVGCPQFFELNQHTIAPYRLSILGRDSLEDYDWKYLCKFNFDRERLSVHARRVPKFARWVIFRKKAPSIDPNETNNLSGYKARIIKANSTQAAKYVALPPSERENTIPTKYELLPEFDELATALIVHFFVTGSSYLRDGLGMDPNTWCYCEEVADAFQTIRFIVNFSTFSVPRVSRDVEGEGVLSDSTVLTRGVVNFKPYHEEEETTLDPTRKVFPLYRVAVPSYFDKYEIHEPECRTM